MPSNSAQNREIEARISCRLVGAEILASICEREQVPDACQGCSAPTRRCTTCGKTRGIADAKSGLCESCAAKNGMPSRKQSDETVDVSLETVLDRVQSIGQPTGVIQPVQKQAVQRQQPLLASPLLKNPESLYGLLLEHATDHEGTWSVQSPLAILRSRKHLLPNECEQVLESLTKREFIQGQQPWTEIMLLKTEDIAQVKEQLELSQTRRVPGAKTGKDKRTVYVPQRRAEQPRQIETAVASPPEAQQVIRRIQNGPTYAAIYAYLVAKSHVVGKERLLGGALVALQLHFKLSTPESKTALEWFVSQGHIVQKDGWRTVVLRAESVASDESPRPPTAQVMRLVSQQPSREVQIPRATSIERNAVKPQSENSNVSIDGMIAELERDLPLLREHRDAVVQKVSALELALLSMKAIQQGGSEGIANRSLVDAAKAARDLLSALHKKNA